MGEVVCLIALILLLHSVSPSSSIMSFSACCSGSYSISPSEQALCLLTLLRKMRTYLRDRDSEPKAGRRYSLEVLPPPWRQSEKKQVTKPNKKLRRTDDKAR
jgi:hypothetical protein